MQTLYHPLGKINMVNLQRIKTRSASFSSILSHLMFIQFCAFAQGGFKSILTNYNHFLDVCSIFMALASLISLLWWERKLDCRSDLVGEVSLLTWDCHWHHVALLPLLTGIHTCTQENLSSWQCGRWVWNLVHQWRFCRGKAHEWGRANKKSDYLQVLYLILSVFPGCKSFYVNVILPGRLNPASPGVTLSPGYFPQHTAGDVPILYSGSRWWRCSLSLS